MGFVTEIIDDVSSILGVIEKEDVLYDNWMKFCSPMTGIQVGTGDPALGAVRYV
ncbi:MAG: hypothetical protein GTN36_01720 [Candidatus Aenigmarchaeota archaeon]|nr:hypothetical protein [Candidatus Aenigmarchaeota archaeon]